MRLILLPVSSRRTLLYCERLEQTGQQAAASMSMMDKATVRAAKLWSEWEHKPAGTWQHRIVSSGNAGLRRIAFEEWGLKSVPPLSSRQRALAAAAAATTTAAAANEPASKSEGTELVRAESKPPAAAVEVIYPSSVIADKDVAGVLHRLSTERDALHRKRLLWCFIGMPISAPFGLVPVIPNIPFFYLAFRAWSHWRALSGGKHVQHLLEHNELVYRPSPVLDAIYGSSKTSPFASGKRAGEASSDEEKLLLAHPEGSKAVAEALGSPALELELERAIWQVETALAKEKATKQQQEQQEQTQEQTQEQKNASDAAAKEKEKQ